MAKHIFVTGGVVSSLGEGMSGPARHRGDQAAMENMQEA